MEPRRFYVEIDTKEKPGLATLVMRSPCHRRIQPNAKQQKIEVRADPSHPGDPPSGIAGPYNLATETLLLVFVTPSPATDIIDRAVGGPDSALSDIDSLVRR